ncbi:MAG: nucleotide sugar dehydrogenase [Halothece sp. Uz-M2-17]|nr:nucleotide sugar dehydrogenase [Halothece sp. Uz-M2-17]
MKIIVWGLGYVGTVVAGCFAKMGHEVIGVDKLEAKLTALNEGKSPIKEPGLNELIQAGVRNGKIRGVSNGISEVASADISLICVGTPSAPDGSTGLQYVRAVAAEIGDGLRHTSQYHVVMMRSTIFPGTTRKVVLPILERHSQKTCGEGFGLVMNPEFLRESTAINDFFDPPYTVVGEFDSKSGDIATQLYAGIPGEVYRTEIETAELLKQTNNAFHALKVGFANEISRLSDRLGINGDQLMTMVCADTKLNISSAYLRPGFAFGGSCLPKDLRSITFHGQQLGENLPILQSILPSNERQVRAAALKVYDLNVRKIAVLGLSFKANTDDLRESPVLKLINDLWRDHMDIQVFDPDVQLENLVGANREYLERQLPQIEKINCSSLEAALEGVEAVIVSHNRPEFQAAIQTLPQHIAVIHLASPQQSYYPMGRVISCENNQSVKQLQRA